MGRLDDGHVCRRDGDRQAQRHRQVRGLAQALDRRMNLFLWPARSRRLNRDYEINPRHSETMIQLAMIHLLLKRL
jgi:hypothetical protein